MIGDFLEWYRERMAIRAVLIFAGLLILSTVMSCREVKYKVFGKTANASVFKVYENPRRSASGRVFVSMYRWQVEGEEEARTDGVNEVGGSSYKPGDMIQIDYLDGSSRLAGQVDWKWPIMLGVCLGLLGLAAAPLVVESYRETRGR